MKREAVRNFIKLGADALDIHFDSGRLTEFNSMRGKQEPFAWLESLSTSTELSNGSTLIDEWDVTIHIARFDAMDSNQELYEAIVDSCDHIARQLIWQYNIILGSSDSLDTSTANRDLYRLTTMGSISREAFIKDHADCMTGIILAFKLTTPDKTDVCP